MSRKPEYLLVLVVAWIHCLLSQHVGASFVVGPIKLRPGPYSFSWQAAVDTSTGVATSVERMQASPSSNIAQHFQSGSERGVPEPEIWSGVIDRLERYPEWLVRGAVTFGLFRAVPVQDGGCSLQDRFLGINFLTFGSPESEKHLQEGLGDCTVTLPIVGGLLALRKPSRNEDMGCLKFTLEQNEALKQTQLITEIQGYSPLLVGSREPAPFYRKCLYLSTQSIIHAYVMWRFQRHCIHTSYLQSDEQQ